MLTNRVLNFLAGKWSAIGVTVVVNIPTHSALSRTATTGHKKNKPEQANTLELQTQDEQVYNMSHQRQKKLYIVVVMVNDICLPMSLCSFAGLFRKD